MKIESYFKKLVNSDSKEKFCYIIVYWIIRGETQRLQTSVKFAARAKWGLQSHELYSLCFVSSNVYYFS